MFERSPGFLQQFRFIFFREKPKLGIDFPNDVVWAFGFHSLAHDGFCNVHTDNHHHVLAQYFGESHEGQPKSCLLPSFYTTSSLLRSNRDKKVSGELLEKLDQAIIHYNGDLHSTTGSKYARKFLQFVFLCKSDKAVQVNCGLSQAITQRLETIMLGPYGGLLVIIAGIFEIGHGSVIFAPVLTFSLNKNL